MQWDSIEINEEIGKILNIIGASGVKRTRMTLSDSMSVKKNYMVFYESDHYEIAVHCDFKWEERQTKELGQNLCIYEKRKPVFNEVETLSIYFETAKGEVIVCLLH